MDRNFIDAHCLPECGVKDDVGTIYHSRGCIVNLVGHHCEPTPLPSHLMPCTNDSWVMGYYQSAN